MMPNFFTINRIKLKKVLLTKWRRWYFKRLGLRFGKNCKLGRISCDWPNNVVIGDDCVIYDNVLLGIGYGFNEKNVIQFGNRVFIGFNVEFNCTTQITVGDDVLIATNTIVVDVGHSFFYQDKPINQQPLISSPIVIEDDVWVGANCVITSGVTIGKGAIIGAGAVVNRSIPANEVWGGVPARFIRKR